jgi:hypothetical protein
MDTNQFIESQLIDYFRKCKTDRYGQVGIIPLRVFGERVDEVKQYLKLNPILQISLYGGSFGTYYGISAWGILDKELYIKCYEVLRNDNISYRYAMTH